MLNLEYDGAGWSYGIKAISELNLQEVSNPGIGGDCRKFRLCEQDPKSKPNKDVGKERAKMIILSYPAYCRFKSLMKKLSSGLIMTKIAMKAFGGVIQCDDCTWVSFSRASFHYPGLAKFDMFNQSKAPVLKGRPRKKKVAKIPTCKDEPKTAQHQSVDAVDFRTSRDPESSDDNQTDTSETSSICAQELPCPPKLVTSVVKEETAVPSQMPKGVIRSLKQASEVLEKPLSIPPIPKLVKIESKERNDISYDQLRHLSDAYLSALHSNPTSCDQAEKDVAAKMSSSIPPSFYGNERVLKPLNSQNGYETSKDSSCGPLDKSESFISSVNGGKQKNFPLTCSAHVTTTSPDFPSTTVTTSHSDRSRISAIVSASPASKGEVTRNMVTSEPSRTEPVILIRGQPVKRKRGRPPGKSTKYLKVSVAKVAPTGVAPGTASAAADKNGVICEVRQKEDEASLALDERKMVDSTGMAEEETYISEPQNSEERKFMKVLKDFMRKRGSPIEKIPALGFKKINLFKMFEVTQRLGGYDQVTSKRLWRRVYSEVGGSPSITSAATNSRRHYEKLLLPYERHIQGKEYKIEMRPYKTPSPNPETIVDHRKDQNGNLISRSEPAVLSPNREDKVSNVIVSHHPQGQQSKMTHAAVSHVTQLSSLDEQSEIFSATTDCREKRQFNSQAVSLCQPKMPPSSVFSAPRSLSQRDGETKAGIAHVTSLDQQNKLTTSAAFSMHQRDIIIQSAASRKNEHPHYRQSSVSAARSSNLQDKDLRPALSEAKAKKQYHAPMDSSSSSTSAVQLITSGNRGSPRMLYSSSMNKMSARFSPPRDILLNSHRVRHSIRPGVIAGSEVEDRANGDLGSTSPDPKRNCTKSTTGETFEEQRSLYIPHSKHKSESRASVKNFGHEYDYLSCFDHVKDMRSLDYHSRVSTNHDTTERSRDSHKRTREAADEIMSTNASPNKMSRARSPQPRDEGYMFPVPVFQPSHYPHGPFELYDLSHGALPVRASSRIFMPSHQVFPGPGHPGTLPPYTPHIITTLGPEPGTLYQLPIPGYYPSELGYPIEPGMQILHS